MWTKTDDKKPKEGQNVLVVVRSDVPNTSGVYETFLSWYTKKPYASEHGHFLDGFAFDDGSYESSPHWESRVIYWMAIPEIPFS